MSFDEFDRERAIIIELDRVGRVVVADLAHRFSVSAVTIRKDLDALERRSMLRRVRGGAVPTGVSDEGAFEMRLRHSARAKRAIARAVAAEVSNGDVIAMDSSTTCWYLAHEILDRRNLIVVTNGLRTAELLMEQSSAMVLMPGGVLRRSAASMVGPIGDVLAGRGRIDKGFFGLIGLSVSHGLLDIVVEEAQTKAFIARSCNEVYGLFDSSKVDRFGLHSFAATDTITGLFTDDAFNAEQTAQWTAAGVDVHRVSVDHDADGADLPEYRRTGSSHPSQRGA
ncbi:MAG: DeoR/GlpR family DNA-binding transcription regulator [Nakamurella sp.]